MLLVSHDLAVIARHCRRVLVMYGGAVMEEGPVEAVLGEARHPYTRALLEARPRLGAPRGERLRAIAGRRAFRIGGAERLPVRGPLPVHDRRLPPRAAAARDGRGGSSRQMHPPRRSGAADVSAPLLEVVDLEKTFLLARTKWFAPRPRRRAVAGVSFVVEAGRSFGIVGESGSGKSTVARAVMALVPPTSGEVRLEGRSLFALSARRIEGDARAFSDDLPGPLRLARSAPERGAHRRRAAWPIWPRFHAPSATRASPRRSRPSASTRARRENIRTNSPAANASASPSRGR